MMHSTNPKKRSARWMALVAAASAALLLTGCVNNESTGTGAGGPSGGPEIKVEKSDTASALVPEDVAAEGVLRVGTDATYAPNQYADENGEPTGWEVELVEAAAAKLGLEVEWSKLGFDQIIPQVTGGTLHMGSSSFSDTLERQKSVDFVDFYSAGLQFVRGADEEPLPDSLCGLTIGAQTTTTSDDYLTEKSEECKANGDKPINILKKDRQDEATSDVVLGNTPYMLADSPISQNSVQVAGDAIVLEGEVFDAAPYGLVFAKDDEMTEAMRTAMQELMDEGIYQQILEKWGVEDGAFTEAMVNSVTE